MIKGHNMKNKISTLLSSKKQLITILTILIVLILVFIAFRYYNTIFLSDKLNKEEMKYLKDKKSIVFTGQLNYAPFEFKETTGDYKGMMVELLQWISVEYGFNLSFEPDSFAEAQALVLSGKVDGITSLFYSEKRKEKFDFSDVVFEVPASIFVLKDRYDIQSLHSLSGKKIAIQKGDYAVEFLNQNNIKADILYVEDFYMAIDKLIESEVDAVIGDEQVVWYHIYKQNYQDKLKKVGEPLYIGENCFAIKKGNNLLLSILNKGINRARKKEILDQIEQKWLGINLAEKKKSSESNIIFYIVITLLILIVIVSILQIRKQIIAKKILETQSRERLKIIINSIPDIIYLRDDKSNIIEFNESFKEFFIEEKSKNINNSGAIDTSILEDIEGKRLTKRSKKKKNNIDNLSEISVKNFIFNLSHTMIQSFEELSFHDQQIIEQKTSEVRNINMINKNGEERLFRVNKISIRDYDGNYKWVLTIARDITFEKRTEAELLKIQKLDSLGMIAGKIAHDFNNILMGIIGNLSLARASIDKKDELIELLDNAIEVSEHAKKLSNQLLSFSKGGYPIKEFFNPLDVVSSVVDLTLKGTSVSYKINFDKDQIFGIFADKNQFFQVLNNIILNSIQAVSAEGNIEINLEFKDLKSFNNTDIKGNYYLIISICDNGCGIPESIMGKIFDPFFTTKENGSGLGLSSVLTICNNHDGYVFCRNNEKDGATFYVLFPATHEKIDLSKRELQQPKSFPGLAIILLDDDEIVINVAKKLFTFFSCNIVTVKNDKELGEYLEKGKFDVCILDIVVPKSLGGIELIGQLREKYPDTIFVVSSGYSSSSVLSNYREHGFDFALKKPYDFEDVQNLLVKIKDKIAKKNN